MSYILDALTKSQQQRRQGDVPTLSTPQLTLDSAKGARARYLNGALIVLIGIAVLFAVHALTRQEAGFSVAPETAAGAPTGAKPAAPVSAPGRQPRLSPTAPEPAAPAPPSLPPKPPVADNPGVPQAAPATGEVVQASEAPTRTPSPPPRPTRPRDLALTDAPIASPPPAATENEPLQPDALSPSAATTQPAAPAPPPMSGEETAAESIEAYPFPGAREAAHPATVRLAEELLELARQPGPRPVPGDIVPVEPATSDVDSPPAPPQASARMAPVSPDREAATAPAPSSTVARAEAIPDAARDFPGGDILPNVRALPEDVQASLGRLTIHAHVYSDAPAGRMVIINMNRYREGDKLREGPRVDAITAKGAILSYESHRFHLNAR